MTGKHGKGTIPSPPLHPTPFSQSPGPIVLPGSNPPYSPKKLTLFFLMGSVRTFIIQILCPICHLIVLMFLSLWLENQSADILIDVI